MKNVKRIKFEDNHIHSVFSDGLLTLEEIFEYNYFHDRLDIALTDHVDKNTDWFDRYAATIRRLRKRYPSFSAKIGCEVKILEDGTLNTTRHILESAELIIGSVHHFDNIKALSPAELIEREYELTRLLAQNKMIDILGHPFSMGRRLLSIDPPAKYVEEIYNLCVKNKIKFEYGLKHAPASIRELVRQEIDRGRIDNFSFGSDVHKELREIGDSAFDVTDPVRILVTGAGAGVGQSIIKSIKLSKIKTRLVVADAKPFAAGLYRGAAAHIIPNCNSKNYVEELIRICKKEQIKFIFPGTDVELPVLAKNKEKIESESSTILVISSKTAIEIADDKWKTVKFLQKNRFPYPYSCLKDDAKEFVKANGFPLVVKPRIGARSVGFSVVFDNKALSEKLALVSDPIVQEYLAEENEEYTCSTFFYKKKNYGVMTSRRYLRNGDTYRAIVKKNPRIENFVAKVGEKLDLYGPCNFQLRRSGGKLKILEINCRFSGTSGMASFLGFNVANWILQKEIFGRPFKKLVFKDAYVFRYWNEIFVEASQYVQLEKSGYLENPGSELNII